jgi:integrase
VRLLWPLSLTGCRLGEIAGLRWSEMDAKDRCLRLDDTKTGRSMRAIGSIPCCLLTDWPLQVGSPSEIVDTGCHTPRHTFGSVASELGYSDTTIAGLLGHKGRGVPRAMCIVPIRPLSQRRKRCRTAWRN